MPVRSPVPALRPFIETLWVSVSDAPASRSIPCREYALPAAGMHLVIRLSGQPIRLIDAAFPDGCDYGYAVIGGARSRYYVRELMEPSLAIGATLLPGAAELLFKVRADELAERHTRLEDVWGYQVAALRQRLIETAQPEKQLDLFESFLLNRLPAIKGMHPAVAQALAQMRGTTNIDWLAKQSGYSHRRFIELFSSTLGLTPKLYCRVQRFQKAVRMVTGPGDWTDIAFDLGYSDQAHFNREFREFSGMTPAEYRKLAPISPGHVRRRA
jgi:AraC-like DNA-binding protein